MIKDKPTKSTVLILNHADGYQVVHGDKHVQVKILNLPPTDSVESELMLEEMLDLMLPQRFKEVYWPGANIRARGQIKPMMMSELNRIITNVDLLYSFYGEHEKKHFPNQRQKILAALEA